MPSNHLILCCPLLLPPSIFPASGSFPMSQFFPSGGQSIGASASASVLPMNSQDWSPLGWTGWISLQPKGLSRVFYTTVQKHQFFSINFWEPQTREDILRLGRTRPEALQLQNQSKSSSGAEAGGEMVKRGWKGGKGKEQKSCWIEAETQTPQRWLLSFQLALDFFPGWPGRRVGSDTIAPISHIFTKCAEHAWTVQETFWFGANHQPSTLEI